MRKLLSLFVLTICMLVVAPTHAQIAVRCGDIIDGEFTKRDEHHQYLLDLQTGDRLTVTAKPFGDSLLAGLYTSSGITHEVVEALQKKTRDFYYIGVLDRQLKSKMRP